MGLRPPVPPHTPHCLLLLLQYTEPDLTSSTQQLSLLGKSLQTTPLRSQPEVKTRSHTQPSHTKARAAHLPQLSCQSQQHAMLCSAQLG